ncbi:MAG: hypothetical protein ABW352_12305 [Polyangiales bacterium]
MTLDRRSFLVRTLCGTGMLGLRSLATGVPVSMLANPARAQSTSLDDPQFLILNTSQAGDPLNCNAPGTYLDSKILHPGDAKMAKRSFMIGGQAWDAAAPWAALDPVFERCALIHHSTETEQHLHQPEVLGLMGSVLAKDMAVSAFAAQLAPALGTIQPQPVTLGTVDSSEAISFRGRPQPMLNPTSLSTVLGGTEGPLANLASLRDKDLDRLNRFFKERGTLEQRRMLDAYATSQGQVRKLSTDLLDQLAALKDNGADAQVAAAIVLIRMKVAPVVTVHIPFGGDNHFDDGLGKETTETVAGMATLAKLFDGLKSVQLSDKVTFASLNVFGRTLTRKDFGRSHNRNHHLTMLVGSRVKGGVIGGVVPKNDDYGALAIDSASGRGGDGGDVSPATSLASVGKTLGAALGLPRDVLDATVVNTSSGKTVGKVIQAALK